MEILPLYPPEHSPHPSPPQKLHFFPTSLWAITPTSESSMRYLGIPMSVSLIIVETASFVCIVDITRCPVNAALTAISAVISSLISETTIISGSFLKVLFRTSGKVTPISSFT